MPGAYLAIQACFGAESRQASGVLVLFILGLERLDADPLLLVGSHRAVDFVCYRVLVSTGRAW